VTSDHGNPPPSRDRAMWVLAEVFAEEHPEYEVVPIEPGRRLPPGARRLPAVSPPRREPERDIGVRRSGERGRDDNGVE
jgi:hypothetical protein